MNMIQQELELAKSKQLQTVDYKNGKKLVCLTRDNVAIVEAMIQNDSAYRRSTRVDAAPIYKKTKPEEKIYGGSSGFWLTRLKRILLENKTDEQYTYEGIIRNSVEAVDRENSTHLNADKKGRDVITKRLCAFDRAELLECIKDPDKGMKLFNKLARRTSAEKGARTNPSFASKFCHYACFFIFEGTEYQDNYSIYDDILKKVMPDYLDFYGFDPAAFDLSDYEQYRKAVDSVREASGLEVSRNGFDHLLWYYHKARL